MSIVAFVLAAWCVQEAEKTYDLRIERKVSEGDKIEMAEESKQAIKLIATANGQTVHEEDKSEVSTYKAVECISKVKNGKRLAATWTFSKALHVTGLVEEARGFEGKTVSVAWDDEGLATFAYEDGKEIPAADLAALRAAFGGGGKDKKGKPKGRELFAPKKPVKVGESWSPDFEEVAKSFGEGMAVDPKTGKGTFTLKSVEKRDGREFARVAGTLELSVTRMGKGELEKGVPMTLEVEGDVSIDGAPDGTLKMTVKVKGASPMDSGMGQTVDIDLDATFTATGTRKTVK